jgi:pyruvate dehydrogenase E1 component
MPEVLKAAKQLMSNGIAAHVIDITAPGRLYRAWHKSPHQLPRHLAELFETGAPIISIHDGASHAMSWLGSALGVRQFSLGVDEFGQSGSINDLYEIHGLSVSVIVNATETILSTRNS